MRYIELLTGYQVPITNEEDLLLKQFQSDSPIPKESFNEREELLIRSLTSRGLLERLKIDDRLHYKLKY